MSLEDYNRKRNFRETPEPEGKSEGKVGAGEVLLRFVVQMHVASRLHFDFRIEVAGVLKSWAIPKGPSLNPQDQRLAIQVEDHPMAYGKFEGEIPKGNYGAGTVMIWDEGVYWERNSKNRSDSEKNVLKGLESGHLTLILKGSKLNGEFAFIRLKLKKRERKQTQSWLLVKKRDEFAVFRHATKTENLAPSNLELPGQTGVKEGLPFRLKPMLPIIQKSFFKTGEWLFEREYGGYRALASVTPGTAHLYSKQGISFNKKFSDVLSVLQGLGISAIFDGELTSESYWIRDLLHLEGENLRNLPLLERKQKLNALPIFCDKLKYVDHFHSGESILEVAENEGDSQILMRAVDSPYVSGTSRFWVRIPLRKSPGGPKLTHLSKVFFPQDQLTKGDLIEYYRGVAPFILPYLTDRPESLHRHPDGIESPGFFQKDWLGHLPSWMKIHRIFSESSQRSIDYLLCQNEWTLLSMVNLGCVEINPWLSRVGNLANPDFCVIDLDPDENPFCEVLEVADEVLRILDLAGVAAYCKTSGNRGLHIYVPLLPGFSYDQSRQFALQLGGVVHQKLPTLTSLERSPAKRRKKIYLDCFQNAQGQTVAAPYCVRPRAGAPVSTPLLREEMVPGLDPMSLNLRSVPKRLEKMGDVWKAALDHKVDLHASLLRLEHVFPMR